MAVHLREVPGGAPWDTEEKLKAPADLSKSIIKYEKTVSQSKKKKKHSCFLIKKVWHEVSLSDPWPPVTHAVVKEEKALLLCSPSDGAELEEARETRASGLGGPPGREGQEEMTLK